ncbi:MAG TPA: sulfotransferase domain-containing protein [Enhygromyxa sp.]|nr:sulfotransferase domain-containing protein [Enhygromyxa sp.]
MTIKPTFVGIGGMKCASTWVSECLRQHPEVLHSTPKETAYFMTRSGLADYQRFFESGGRSYNAIGEFTPTYLPNAAIISRRIFETLGRVQILVILRNPCKRYISHYKWAIGRREELPLRSFSSLNPRTFELVNSIEPRMLEFGHYRADLQTYADCFGRENLHVMLYEDVRRDALKVVRELFEFLGVDPSFVPPSLDEKVREGYVPKYPALEWAKNKGYFLVKANLPGAIDPLKRLGLEKLLRRINAANDEPLVVAPEVEQALADHYAEEIDQMREFLGRPLTEWG